MSCHSRQTRRACALVILLNTMLCFGSIGFVAAEENPGKPADKPAAAAGVPAPATNATSYPKMESSLSGLMSSPGAPAELPIDLPTVLRLAHTDALEVRLASERLDEARANRLAADFKFLPSIQLIFENRWHDGRAQAVNGPFLDVNKQSSLLGGGISGEWRLGESVFQSLAARRRVEASDAGLKATADDARIRAVNAFLTLVQARTDQAITEDRLKQADETIRINEELQKGGAGLLSEVRRSQAARAEVRQRLAAAKEGVRVSSLNLTDVLNIDPLVTLVPHQESQEMVAMVPADKELVELVSLAMARRPELAESRALWAALDKERRAAFLAPFIPTIRAEAFGGGFGPHPNDFRHTSEFYVGVQWKVGAGGIGDVSRTRIAESRLQQEGTRYAQINDRVVREVVENYIHAQTAKEQIELSKEEITAAEETLKLSQERLKNGAALTIEVLSAEDALFAAKSRAAQQVSEYNKAQYGLLRSIGGFRTSDFEEK